MTSDDGTRDDQPERTRPDRGVRYVLDRARESSDADSYRYRGRIEGEGAGWTIEVVVRDGADTPDGLSAEAEVEGAPPERRQAHEKMAAAMVRAAVRRALKEGLRPPRRIQRWRDR